MPTILMLTMLKLIITLLTIDNLYDNNKANNDNTVLVIMLRMVILMLRMITILPMINKMLTYTLKGQAGVTQVVVKLNFTREYQSSDVVLIVDLLQRVRFIPVSSRRIYRG